MANVEYVFSATGADGVVSAFKSIGASADEQAKRGERAWNGAKKPLSDLEKLAKKVAADQERAAAKAAAAQEKASQKASAAAEKSAAAQSKAAEKGAQAQVKAAEKASAAQEKAATKASKAQQKEIDKTTAKQLAAFAKITASSKRAVDQMAKDQERAAASIAKSIQKSILGAASQVGGAIFSFASDKLGGAARESMALQGASRRLSIAGRKPGENGLDPSIIRRTIENAAIANPGVESSDVAKGLETYVSKSGGDLEGGMKYAGIFAKTASATGASAEQVGDLGAALQKKFNIKDVSQMDEALAHFAAEAKTSGITIQDAAEHFDKLSGAAKRFGVGEGIEGVRRVSALTSLARQTSGPGAGADQAVEMLFKSLTNKAGKLPDVLFKGGQARPLEESIPELIAKVGGNNMARKRTDLAKATGRGFAAISPLVDTYTKTFESTQGNDAQKTAAATEAVSEQFKKLASASSEVEDRDRDAATAQQGTSAQLQGAWESLVKQVGAEVIPALSELMPSIMKITNDAIPPLITALKFLVTNLEGFANFLKDVGLIDDNTTGVRVENDPTKARAALIKNEREFKALGDSATQEDREKHDAFVNSYVNSYSAKHEGAAPEDIVDGFLKFKEHKGANSVMGANEEFVNPTAIKASPTYKPGQGGAPYAPVATTNAPTSGSMGSGAGGGDLKGAADQTKQAAADHKEAAKALITAAKALNAAGSVFGGSH